MDFILNMPLFLVSVAFISLSGVMMPGPVTTVTIAKGRSRGNAGALIAVGHGVIEIPLMLLIYFGFAPFFTLEVVRKGIGFVGGIMLSLMGVQMLLTKNHGEKGMESRGFSSVVSGVATTGANPYFFLWWATIGSALVINSTLFGITGFVLFALVHWLCDFFWYSFVSLSVYRSRRLWTPIVHRIVFGICGGVLMIFGVWFIYSVLMPV